MDTFEEIIGSAMLGGNKEEAIGKACIKAAVMRAIFCPSCGDVMDQRRAVYVEINGRPMINCATCFDNVVASLKAKGGAEILDRAEIYDGRLLFARPKRAPKAK